MLRTNSNGGTDDVLLTAVPARRSTATTLWLRNNLVLIGLALLLVMGVLSLGLTLTRDTTPPALPPVAAGRATAEIAVRDMLAGRPPSVPVADGVSTIGRDSVGSADLSELAWYRFEVTHVEGRRLERHVFVATTADDVFYVSVLVDASVAPQVVVAAPAITPYIPTGKVAPSNYSSLLQSNLNSAARSRVQAWAAAYAADDRDALYTLTGDTNPGVYHGLGRFDAGEVQIVAATGDSPVLARVSVPLTSADGWATTQEFDLLIADPDTQGPKVVAWGAAGSGPTLSPFINRSSQ